VTARALSIVGLCVAAAGVATSAQPRGEEIGFVVSVQGEWQVVGDPKSTAKMTPLTTVHAGEVLRKVTAGPSLIVVALYSGSIAKYIATTRLPSRDRSYVWDRVMQALRPHVHEGRISAAVRGGVDLHDLVAREDSTGVDLSGVFRNAPAGAYSITILALDDRGVPVPPPRVSTRLQVARSARGPALPSGLYQIDASSGPGGAAGLAWLRVVSPAEYSNAREAFRRLSEEADSRDPDLRAAARAVARAYLLTLDESATSR
jgi:hypothetical protein